MWLAGSTASGWDPLEETERVLALQIDSRGRLSTKVSLPGDRAIDGTSGPAAELWIATCTREDTDRGALYLLGREVLLQWQPPVPSGVGAPLLLGDNTIQVPTSQGFFCLQLSVAGN
jgi:hypothetical protein